MRDMRDKAWNGMSKTDWDEILYKFGYVLFDKYADNADDDENNDESITDLHSGICEVNESANESVDDDETVNESVDDEYANDEPVVSLTAKTDYKTINTLFRRNTKASKFNTRTLNEDIPQETKRFAKRNDKLWNVRINY